MNPVLSKDYIAQFLPTNPIIIEAGAHIGRDTVKMAKKWKSGTIYAFEPIPELFEQLKKNTHNLSNVFCYNYALSDKSGSCRMYKSSGRSTATSSLLKPKEYAQEFPQTIFEEIEVTCITLDEWAQQHNIFHVDFLWFDMQGSELNALKGAVNLLKTVSVIYTEVNLTERYEHNPLYNELRQWLASHHFEIQQEALGKNWGNVLFKRKEN